MNRALLVLLAISVCGCEGKLVGPGPLGGEGGSATGGAGGSMGTGGGGGGGSVAALSNLDVYTRLNASCGGCHTLTNRPYFASLEAFESSIAYDPRWVTPGDPTTSVLMELLDGRRAVRMPPAPQPTFAVMAGNGQTLISILELEEWIRNLTPRTVTPPLDVPVVRRKTAEQVITSLQDQLGLSESDFYDASWNPYANDTYAVRSPDAVPYADAFDQGGTLFMAMGGPWRLEGKLRNDAPSLGFVQALTHVSQAWCRTAFNKPGNTAVFTRATLSDASSTTGGAMNIRSNIADLYLRMLGADPPQAEVDDLFDNVFKPYEPRGALVAWTAVCSSLVRDPLWMLY